MFARTLALTAKEIDLENPDAVLDFLAESIRKDLVGHPPITLYLLADVDPEIGKVILYDIRIQEQIMEISNLFGRIPVYSIVVNPDTAYLYYLDSKGSKARVIGYKTEDGKITSVIRSKDADEKATQDLHEAVSANFSLIEAAMGVSGTVIPAVAENEKTKERRAMFTVKIDGKSTDHRLVFRAAKKVLFAWSLDTSHMIFICKVDILPPFSMFLPIIGKGAKDAMELYHKNEKAVGMIMYSNDVTDSLEIHKGIPTFVD